MPRPCRDCMTKAIDDHGRTREVPLQTTSVISQSNQVTPVWLTVVLRRNSALTEGAVKSLAVDTGRGNWSSNARLAVTYTPEAQGDLPAKLFLKMTNTDTGDGEYFDGSEVNYYVRDYVGVPDAPLLRCYDGVYDAAAHRYHLLLDDVSDTHTTADDLMPTAGYGQALAEGLAVLHATWWGADRLAAAGAPIHDAAHIQRFVDIAAPGVDPILAGASDQLQPDWPALIRQLFEQHPPALVARTADANGFTLIHGDPGVMNILVPRIGDRPVYLIDRQPFDWSLTTWLGVYDLVYAMVLDWDVADRRKLERQVLTHYHTTLLERGIIGYSWDQLWHDYRLIVPMAVYIAVEYCRGGLNSEWAWLWMTMLQRALIAVEDLDCRQLWSS